MDALSTASAGQNPDRLFRTSSFLRLQSLAPFLFSSGMRGGFLVSLRVLPLKFEPAGGGDSPHSGRDGAAIPNTDSSLTIRVTSSLHPRQFSTQQCSAGAAGCDLKSCSGVPRPSPTSRPSSPAEIPQSQISWSPTCPASTCPQHKPAYAHQLRRKGQACLVLRCAQSRLSPQDPGREARTEGSPGRSP